MPSVLSHSASAVYILVVLVCAGAAAVAVRHRQRPSHARVWLALAAFFAALVVMRLLAVEDVLRDTLRDTLKSSNNYEERRELQAPIIAALLVIGFSAGSFLVYRWGRGLRGRRNYMVFIGILAAFAMACLIVLRLISLHAIDGLLYGPIKLNWVIDLGASLAVMLAAFNYARLVRARP
jgi:hypothetical protein